MRLASLLAPEHAHSSPSALTLVGIVMTGCAVGSMLPLVLRKCGVDPPQAPRLSSPSLVDVLSIIVFVHVAKVVMASVILAHNSP